MNQGGSLNWLWRLHIYGLHGLLCEIMYTALWEVLVTSRPTLLGVTSVWTVLVYGISTLVIEWMSSKLKPKLPLPLRAFIYLLWVYSWEFSSGLLLKQFNACPWDYEPWFSYHFMGLITLEYAPMWYFGCILTDVFLIPYTKNIAWISAKKNV